MADNSALDTAFSAAVGADESFTLSAKLDGELAKNAYQNNRFGFGMQFEMAARSSGGGDGRDDKHPPVTPTPDIPDPEVPGGEIPRNSSPTNRVHRLGHGHCSCPSLRFIGRPRVTGRTAARIFPLIV